MVPVSDSEFEELLGLYDFQQSVLGPTQENFILDFMFCNEPNIVSGITVCPGISDHRAVITEVSVQLVRTSKVPQRRFQLCQRRLCCY